jgi:anaerobic magnesium-protoporphyrin IX monomethyl ester cyclase
MLQRDLVVINPSAAHGIYGKLGNELTAVEPPLWARLIAGYVLDSGFGVRIIDAEAERRSPAHVALDCFAENPRLVVIAVYGHQPSASTQQMVAALETARQVRAACPAPIIFVGGHVSALPVETLQQYDFIDYVAKGEGPVTIAGLLRGGRFEDIPGLVWRSCLTPGGVKVNAPAPLLDLDKLHGKAWHLLPMQKYRAHNWQCFGDLALRVPYAAIYTSLGCPYKCEFCCINSPFGTNRYRTRHPYDVVREVEMLHDTYGVKTFKIIDEMFVLKKAHYVSICQGLAQLPFADELNIWAYARVDTVKKDTLSLMRKAGIRWLALGIESGSAYVRDGAEKSFSNADIRLTVRAIQEAGINVIGNYIFGLPDDTFESMQETMDLALTLRTEFANFYSAMAYPGSPLYDRAIRESLELPDSWSGYSQHNPDCKPLGNLNISPAEVVAFRDQSFITYFRNEAYLEVIRQKFGDETVEHIAIMLNYSLPRKLLGGLSVEQLTLEQYKSLSICRRK